MTSTRVSGLTDNDTHRRWRGPSPRQPLGVVKVGGSLLRDRPDLPRLADAIARRRCEGPLLVVVSALNGVTDALERAALYAALPGVGKARAAEMINGLERRHHHVAESIPQTTGWPVATLFRELRALFAHAHDRGGLAGAEVARVMSFGERLAAPLLAAAIRAAGVDARAIDSEEAGLRGIGQRDTGRLDLAGCPLPAALRQELGERVLVLTGFYGVNRRGEVVLFGRGGSDYTAGAMSALLEASSLELWKDVPGFMSADPRAVPAARWVPLLSFSEVSSLGRLGAETLHRACLEPLRGRPTRVRVGLCDGRGTQIVERRDRSVGAVVVAGRSRQSVVRLHRTEIVGGSASVQELMAWLHESEVAVRDVKSTRNSLCFSIPHAHLHLVREILRRHPSQAKERLEIIDRPAEIGLVGEGVGDDDRLSDRLVRCLRAVGANGSPVQRCATGAELRTVLSEDDHLPALLAVHEAIFGGQGAVGHA